MVDGPRLIRLNAKREICDLPLGKALIAAAQLLCPPTCRPYSWESAASREQCDVWEGAEPCSKEQFSAKLKASVELELDKCINEVRN